MGSKNNPGNYDCYANADPDEPMFVLLGRDRHAAVLTRVWALLRSREGEDEAKVAEALTCAGSMDEWRKKLGKNPFADRPAHIGRVLEAATEGMDEHPDDYDDSCCCNECCNYQ